MKLYRTLFGGPSQPEPDDLRGGICRAEKLAHENEEVVNLNQYTNDLVGFRLTSGLQDDEF